VDVPADFELIACPGCGAAGFVIVHEGRDWVLNDPAVTMRIVRCERCGLHYTNPRPRLEHLGRYYPDEYAPYLSDGAEDRTGAGGSIRSLVLRRAYGAPHLRPRGLAGALAGGLAMLRSPRHFGFGVPWRGEGRLLDFGCGGGKFLRRMHALGWTVTGIDFSASAVSALRESGINALVGTLPHPELLPQSFDVVTMRHSLEHVPDPPAVLRAARELLAPGGRLVIQVPNFASWEVDYFGDASPRLDLPRHLMHFTPSTLGAMLERAGFSVIRLRQVCRANWLKKAARLAPERGPKRRIGFAFRATLPCRLAARWCELTHRGNELIAIAKPIDAR
jgi:2-polyprenyl-3-methyl-5-hydroxy-6-metoxy-1,4-benzoquinol methylase